VPELTAAELQMLLKAADRGRKGYVATDKFVDRLKDLVSETKEETALRIFALTCKRQSINLRQELMRFDASRSGKLDKRTFVKALSQLPITLADDATDVLFSAGEVMN
jgi:Ca2+-binding EF-hand superfamily protein